MRGSQASHPQGTTGDISRHSVQLRWGSSAVGFHCNRVVQQNAVTVRLITPSVVHRRTAPGAQREGDDRLAPLRLLRLLLDLPLAGPHRGQFRCACAPPPAHIPPLLPPRITRAGCCPSFCTCIRRPPPNHQLVLPWEKDVDIPCRPFVCGSSSSPGLSNDTVLPLLTCPSPLEEACLVARAPTAQIQQH